MSNGSSGSEGRSITTAGEFSTQLGNGIQALQAVQAAFAAAEANATFMPEALGPKPLPQVTGGCRVPLWVPSDKVTVGQVDTVLGGVPGMFKGHAVRSYPEPVTVCLIRYRLYFFSREVKAPGDIWWRREPALTAVDLDEISSAPQVLTHHRPELIWTVDEPAPRLQRLHDLVVPLAYVPVAGRL